MAHKIFLVSYRWIKTAPDVEKITAVVRTVADDWLRLNVHMWFLWTAKAPSEIHASLVHTISSEDSIFIMPVDPAVMPVGWCPQFVWDWFRQKAEFIKLGL